MQLIEPVAAGGAESVVRALTTALRATGLDAEIVALVPPDATHPFVDGARADGLPVTTVPRTRGRYDREVRAVINLLRHTRVDIIHTHVMRSNLVGAVAARYARIPTVSTQHGFTAVGWRGDVYTWLDLQLMRRCDAVFAVSRPVQQRLIERGCTADRVHLVPNGFVATDQVSREAARAELGAPAVGPVVGFIGRLSREKGADILIEAVSRAGIPGLTTVIIGEGEERQSLELLAQERQGRFIFAGRVVSAARLLPALDAIAISSRSEGTPMVLLEAMAAGIPVAAFSVGGIPDAIPSDAGWLVRPLDTVALANALAHIVADPAAAGRRAARAQRVVADRYSAGPWAQRVQTVYEHVRQTWRDR